MLQLRVCVILIQNKKKITLLHIPRKPQHFSICIELNVYFVWATSSPFLILVYERVAFDTSPSTGYVNWEPSIFSLHHEFISLSAS